MLYGTFILHGPKLKHGTNNDDKLGALSGQDSKWQIMDQSNKQNDSMKNNPTRLIEGHVLK